MVASTANEWRGLISKLKKKGVEAALAAALSERVDQTEAEEVRIA